MKGETKLAMWMCGFTLTTGGLLFYVVYGGMSRGIEKVLILVLLMMGNGLYATASFLPKGTFK